MKKLMSITAFAALIALTGSFTGTAHAKGSSTYKCTVTQSTGTSTQSFTDDAAEDHWEVLYAGTGSCTGD